MLWGRSLAGHNLSRRCCWVHAIHADPSQIRDRGRRGFYDRSSMTHGAAPEVAQSPELAMMPFCPPMQQLPCPPGRVAQPEPPHDPHSMSQHTDACPVKIPTRPTMPSGHVGTEGAKRDDQPAEPAQIAIRNEFTAVRVAQQRR